MKKNLTITVIIGFLFAVYNTGNAGNEVKRLPSKITVTCEACGKGAIIFEYDHLNRLVKIENIWFGDTLKIEYDKNHNPVKMDIDGEERLFQYNGNQISVSRTGLKKQPHKPDILTINPSGKLVKLIHLHYSSLVACDIIVEETIEFSYTDETTTTTVSTKFEDNDYDDSYKSIYTPSHVKSIWQYVNVPDWLLTYTGTNLQAELWMKKNRNMQSRHEQHYFEFEFNPFELDTYTYELDDNGYVKQINIESRTHMFGNFDKIYYSTVNIEYIPASKNE
ncbi:MAG: hypothetical protein LBH22_01535 [Bacteroidales bacterium]|jgi:hypothetical protein|nr:hypothetical protein [Bacteroidales bacterium]